MYRYHYHNILKKYYYKIIIFYIKNKTRIAEALGPRKSAITLTCQTSTTCSTVTCQTSSIAQQRAICTVATIIIITLKNIIKKKSF
jgi:hypothetical protein